MLGQRRTRWANTAPAPAALPRLLGYCLEAGPALKQNITTTTPICGIGGGGGGGGSGVPERGAHPHRGAWSQCQASVTGTQSMAQAHH